MTDDDEELIGEFLVESYENLQQLDADLVALERESAGSGTLSSVFRTIHTIKGTCGFLGFTKLEALTHVGENLLAKLRDGSLAVDAPIISALLALVDAVREVLGSIENHLGEGDGDYGALMERLAELADGRASGPAAGDEPDLLATPGSPPRAEDPPAHGPAPLAEDDGAPRAHGVAEEPVPGAAIERDGREAIERPARAEEQVPVLVALGARDRVPADPVTTNGHGAPVTEQAHEVPEPAASAGGEGTGPSAADLSIRVDVGLLDKLMNLVGELVLARNQILQHSTTIVDPGLVATTQRLNLITSELQGAVMKTRMQPIGNVWSKFPRILRDLALACGKEVRLEMEGRDTELDKTIIEAIKDPLTHLVRNAVDHGLESPEERAAAGKPREGRLSLRAFHEGGHVNIEIADDGAGIDIERVRAKAVERGLLSAERAAACSDRDVGGFIFLPGLSTAEKLTNVSGRGVGMDVVKTNIEKIGGTIDLASEPGRGTSFRIKIPLTLAIIPALIVTSAGERYAIPQVNLVELLHLDGEQATRSIEQIHGTPVCRLRGNLLPLVDLAGELGTARDALGALASSSLHIVVVQAGERQFGLVVGGVHDTEEIVVKPLGKQLKEIGAFAGATIMGDGRVALILDIVGLGERAGVLASVEDAQAQESESVAAAAAAAAEALLLLEIGDRIRATIPLERVDRLEEFARPAIERVGGSDVVQYRDEILPLVHLGRFFDILEAEGSGPAKVVVTRVRSRTVGLVVREVLDIVEQRVALTATGGERGVRGAVVVDGQVTNLLDIEEIVALSLPAFAITASLEEVGA